MGRVRVYDAEELAVGMTERFKNRPWEMREELPFPWPNRMQNVGDSLGVAYASDKWKSKKKDGKRDWDLYKHLAESRNRALVRPGFLYDEFKPNKRWGAKGPMVSLEEVPLPKHYARLALFEEINLQLYTRGSNRNPRFSKDKDEGIVSVRVRHGILGGSYLRWSEEYEDAEDQPFLFVYTRASGVCIIVVGDELDVHKDGIIG